MRALVQRVGEGEEGRGAHGVACIFRGAGEHFARPAGEHLDDDQRQDRDQA